MDATERVCVTGAGGFLASWVVKLLLSKGYIVLGTARNPSDQKFDHLTKLEKAPENLKLFKADLLDYDALRSAIQGCSGVLHVASPVIETAADPETDILQPVVSGALNVLKACSEAKVKRVVVVSSIDAVLWNPSWPDDKLMDEACWSDREFCRKNQRWYALSKTEAEALALDYGKKNGIDVLTVCPTFILGPVMMPVVSPSAHLLINFLHGEDIFPEFLKDYAARSMDIVDVREVAAAIALAYEKPEAEGRYICTSHAIKTRDFTEMMKRLYPNFTYSENYKEQKDSTLSSAKLQKLGWTDRPLEEILVDTIESYRATGILKC